jgi:hypothetical protein
LLLLLNHSHKTLNSILDNEINTQLGLLIAGQIELAD